MTHELVTWLGGVLDRIEQTAQAAAHLQADPENGWGIEGIAITPHIGIVHEDEARQHIVANSPANVLPLVAAIRAILTDWQQDLDHYATHTSGSDAELHARMAHPDWEYTLTEGQRKAWNDIDVPPDGEGWERNLDAGYAGEGWERFDYHEESYWRRRRPEGSRDEPVIPSHIRHLAAGFSHWPGYRPEWGPQ